MDTQTKNKIISIIEKAASEKVKDENTNLVEDLGMDVLDLQEAVMDLETEFNIEEIPLETAESWRTVADVIKYVEGVCNRQS
uniref:Carrier domain-containing protein n=1 Tax=viral metagenome TaxID=1070528 RepID=A0A6M3J0D1_9ZZZZ